MYNKPLSKENILNLITEYDIWRYYCLPFKKIGQLFCSEIRGDSRPTCSIFNNKSNRLIYKDFGSTDYFDCFGYIQRKYGYSYWEALKTVNNDFSLNLGGFKSTSPTNGTTPSLYHKSVLNSKKRPTEIKVRIRKWNLNDKAYWNTKYKFTCRDLIFYKAYPLSHFWINEDMFIAEKLSYGYFGGWHLDGREKWKIYQPFSKKKWFSNNHLGDYQGIDQLPLGGDKLIITKGLKDVICLYKLGYNAIAPHGEHHSLNLEHLRTRFDRIDLLYDNDGPGLKAAESKSKAHNIGNIVLPQFEDGKDISDYIEIYGYNKAKDFLASYYS